MSQSLFTLVTKSGKARPVQGAIPSEIIKPVKLADHFAACSRLGRYLTLVESGRFVISDDFLSPRMPRDAVALASICSKDEVVARAALLPLGRIGAQAKNRGAYEELFSLIERQALSPRVRAEADAMLEGGFREARILELEASLHDELNPARLRYRTFLETVALLVAGKVSHGFFLDDFIDFTNTVAGRLDFGIYSFCLDRIFSAPAIPLKLKKTLVVELMGFPPLIRRELLSNILASAATNQELAAFTRHAMAMHLKKERVLEVELLEAVKMKRLSTGDIELSLKGQNAAFASGQA
ncbi:MAG: hypothetical protein OEX17_05805 [Rhodospirillaceae bacterium]|nr:hypothetical protein [Rhodospirillaceae bacterium]